MKPEKGWIEDRLKHKIGAPLIRFCEKLIPLKLWMRPECAKQVKCYFLREREGEKKCKNKIKIKKPKKTNMNKVKQNQHVSSTFYMTYVDIQVSIFLSPVNDSKDSLFYIVSGTIDQILGARYDIVSVSYFTELILPLGNVL